MNDEIKKILDKMIKTSHPNGVFLTAETRDKIIYYITNLQQENERLKEEKQRLLYNLEKVCEENATTNN